MPGTWTPRRASRSSTCVSRLVYPERDALMIIEITKPEIEALIQRRLRSGDYADAEDVILHALRSSEPRRFTGADLIAAMQASPYKEIGIEPSRERLPVRDAAF
jgi:Arc/MetJ-type ribon-helix-helix transcriptional regulator